MRWPVFKAIPMAAAAGVEAQFAQGLQGGGTVCLSTSTKRYPQPNPSGLAGEPSGKRGNLARQAPLGRLPACRTASPNPFTLHNGDDFPGKLTVSPPAGSQETLPALSHR